jgi:hypothetical protein
MTNSFRSLTLTNALETVELTTLTTSNAHSSLVAHHLFSGSEFTQIGDSAVVLWGWTNSTDPRSPLGTGPDGSEGNQPRGTVVEGCLCHEYARPLYSDSGNA